LIGIAQMEFTGWWAAAGTDLGLSTDCFLAA